MFDDDVLFAGAASTDEWRAFHLVLTNFGAVSGLIMNKEKSELIFDRLDGETEEEIASLFHKIELGVMCMSMDLIVMKHVEDTWFNKFRDEV